MASELELPLGAPIRAGEGAALVAEDQRLDQRAGEGRAVDGDEGLLAPGARLVESAGD